MNECEFTFDSIVSCEVFLLHAYFLFYKTPEEMLTDHAGVIQYIQTVLFLPLQCTFT